jgi:hypothetical protein
MTQAKRDAADILREEGADALRARVDQDIGRAARATLADTLAVFDQWLLLPSPTPILAVLGAIAANYLPGDPVWLGLIGPPSSAKTEILNSTLLLPRVVEAGTLTAAALLSGTPRKQRDEGAKGGLLQQIGDFGIIMLKDFGSILSMRPDTKSETLGALREVFDGRWTRMLGTDGGKQLNWGGQARTGFRRNRRDRCALRCARRDG